MMNVMYLYRQMDCNLPLHPIVVPLTNYSRLTTDD